MSRFVKASAAAIFVAGSTFLMAQAQNPTGDPRPLPPGGVDNPSVNDPKAAPTNPTKAAPPTDNTGTGSRPIGPPGNETPAPGATKDTKGVDKKSPQ